MQDRVDWQAVSYDPALGLLAACMFLGALCRLKPPAAGCFNITAMNFGNWMHVSRPNIYALGIGLKRAWTYPSNWCVRAG
ncbi:hypothetical protein B0T22DRAFT_474247 [Podospora appendiculata]|uniref:Uncharacterized protein n=1 Tax=Podospora appendiculata TaxID=314037 RepID=A0AAE0WZ59_9PEZI|nr:hypothetical protein B0T22DRAFT_474247 [Podospora appendiculata]